MLDSCRGKNTILRRWIENILGELKVRPYIGEKLFANFPGCRSNHFGGNSYRVIYRVLDESQILILDIGHRSSSYANLARVLGKGN